MTEPLLGLSQQDFEAFSPDRASSNAYSRPRLEFKQRALGWARSVVERLEQLGMDVTLHASDEYPSVRNAHRVECLQVVFEIDDPHRTALAALLNRQRAFAKDLEEPNPHAQHMHLAFRLDAYTVQVGLCVPLSATCDRDTLRARLVTEETSAPLLEAFSGLPEQFALGPAPGTSHLLSTLTQAQLHQTIEQLISTPATFWVGWSIPRSVALQHSELLDEQLVDALGVLAGIYHAVAWRADDDPAGLESKLRQEREQAMRDSAQRTMLEERLREEAQRLREATTEASRERTRERLEYRKPHPTLGTLFKKEPAVQRDASDAATRNSPTPFAGSRKPPLAPRVRGNESTSSATAVLAKGSRVRVLSGPFCGKLGVVRELDGRGGARVLLGLLAARLSVDELELEPSDDAKQRPPMQSSHRRPESKLR